jgi:glycosyltransferase involved in cell wall biosynthesis/ubiquinone/menaquinone biosynthesis C-methylase UbiE
LKFVIEAAGFTVAGGKELALDLMSRLAAHAEHQFTFIVPDLPAYKAISGGNIRSIVCPKGSGLLHRARLLNHQVPEICRREGADALLCLGNFTPWKRVCPTTVLLQNAWIVYGDPVADSRRTLREHLITAYGRFAYRHLSSDISIITQTPVMKDHLCRRYGIQAERVAIIPNTLSLTKLGEVHRRTPPAGSERPRPFTFLCLAHCYAHKNIDILADAALRLPKYTSLSARCVITVAAEQHPGARRLLKRLGNEKLAEKIENIGPVPGEMLAQVYQSADALIFPTLLESFSRTYLEALHFGLPILTSDRDFAHHLCRNAASYFDPLDADSVARAMARVMEDAHLRRSLIENGRRILAESPTWDDIASRFVEVLERTARGEVGSRQKAGGRRQEAVGSWWKAEGGRLKAEGSGQREDAGNSLPADVPWPAWPCPGTGRMPVAQSAGPMHRSSKLPPSSDCLLPTAHGLPPSADVRTLFNHKARGWRNKYGSRGKLNSRVEQFAARLAGHCPPPARILDLGCGTGEIAAAIDQMGYQVTACDFAEEMLAVARSNYFATAVDWVRLEPDWQTLPFADGSFDGIVASSVFEYLDDVHQVAAEVSRVLRPEGVLLLTVPNPANVVRKLEARLQSASVFHRLAPALRKVQRLDSYAAYLRLSRNRFDAPGWQAVLNAAHFAAVDEQEFSSPAWQHQSKAPLVLLTVKRMATVGGGQNDAEGALCRPVLT